MDELVRDGARQMLAAALQAEVAAYIEQFADVLDQDGHRLVVRNGYHQQRAVANGAGAVTVTAPNAKRSWPANERHCLRCPPIASHISSIARRH